MTEKQQLLDQDIYAEIKRGVADGIAQAARLTIPDGIDRIREVTLAHLHSVGWIGVGLTVYAAIDAQIALEGLKRAP